MSDRSVLVSLTLVAAGATLAATALGTPVSDGQSRVAADTRPAFAVASIRPSKSERQGGPYFMPGGRFRATGATLKLLMRVAYSYGRGGPLMNYEFADEPSWVDTDRFDIEATAADAGPSDPLALLRLQRLLEERFSLRMRTDTRVRPVYDLVVARGDRRLGPQLRASSLSCPPPGGPPPSSAQPCGLDLGPGRMRGRGVELSYVALVLSGTGSIDRRVRDRTGLGGQFDLDLSWSPEPFEIRGDSSDGAAARVAIDPSIFTALEEQLGLKLQPSSAPMDVFVIDSVERPTAN